MINSSEYPVDSATESFGADSFANLDAPLTDFPNHASNEVPAVDFFQDLIIKNQFTELRVQQLTFESSISDRLILGRVTKA